MDPCKYREPQVINHLMIAKCLEEQGLKGELGRLAREEGIPWDEVLHIRLEFMSKKLHYSTTSANTNNNY